MCIVFQITLFFQRNFMKQIEVQGLEQKGHSYKCISIPFFFLIKANEENNIWTKTPVSKHSHFPISFVLLLTKEWKYRTCNIETVIFQSLIVHKANILFLMNKNKCHVVHKFTEWDSDLDIFHIKIKQFIILVGWFDMINVAL